MRKKTLGFDSFKVAEGQVVINVCTPLCDGKAGASFKGPTFYYTFYF